MMTLIDKLEYDTYLEFIKTDFYNKKMFILNKNKEMIRGLNSKEFKDFLVRREMDYKVFYQKLKEISLLKNVKLGSILELNTVPDLGISALDYDEYFDITVVNKYACTELYGEQYFKYYNGELAYLEMMNVENKVREFYLKYYKSFKDAKSLSQFDTLLNVNPQDKKTILDLYLYSLRHKKNIITGYLTNIYDKLYEEKEEFMEYVVYELEKRGIEAEELDYYETGTKVRLITLLN